MAEITPVRFTPQFDPITHQGYVSQLQRLQSEYDKAYANQLAAEDMYSQLPTAVEDIAGKQMLIGNFQSKIQDLVDKAGGDYGAVSKQIAREVSRLRQNPFVQLTAQKSKLAEEERQMRAKLGVNAIPIQSVLGKSILDEEGNLQMTQDDLQYNILDQRDILQRALQEYSPLSKQRREGELKQVRPGLLKQDTIFGLTKQEAAEKAPEIAEYLISQYPELAQAARSGSFNIEDFSSNIANQLVMGSTSQTMRDPSYSETGRKAVESSAGRMPYFTQPGLKKDTKTAFDYSDKLEKAKAAKGLVNYNDINIVEKAAELGTTPEQIERDMNILNENAKREYDNAIAPFKKMKSFDYLTTEKGLDDIAAAEIITQNQKTKEEAGVFGNVYYPTDIPELKPKIIRSFTGEQAKDFPLYKVVDGKLEKQTKWFGKDPNVQEILSSEDVADIGFDFDEGQVEFQIKTKDGFDTYRVDFNAIGNSGSRSSLNNFKTFLSAYSGEEKPGVYQLGSDDDPQYMMEVNYNEETQSFDKVIHKIVKDPQGNMYRIPNVPIQFAMKEASENLFDYFGEQPEYITTQGVRTRTK